MLCWYIIKSFLTDTCLSCLIIVPYNARQIPGTYQIKDSEVKYIQHKRGLSIVPTTSIFTVNGMWCPLPFPLKNDVRFVFTLICLCKGFVFHLCFRKGFVFHLCVCKGFMFHLCFCKGFVFHLCFCKGFVFHLCFSKGFVFHLCF